MKKSSPSKLYKQERPCIITYIATEPIKVDVKDFKSKVQELTGKNSTQRVLPSNPMDIPPLVGSHGHGQGYRHQPNIWHQEGFINNNGHQPNISYQEGFINNNGHQPNIPYQEGFINNNGHQLNIPQQESFISNYDHQSNVPHQEGFIYNYDHHPNVQHQEGFIYNYDHQSNVPHQEGFTNNYGHQPYIPHQESVTNNNYYYNCDNIPNALVKSGTSNVMEEQVNVGFDAHTNIIGEDNFSIYIDDILWKNIQLMLELL
ncbi:unnamed protein product [Amaranthus hypochondriacus]